MLRKLKIKDFQKHESLDIDLDPGVNVVIGKSGAGKSAGLVRPLKLIVFNKPYGESFRKWGSQETSVTVTLEDGTEVSRIRSDKDNLYKIDDEIFRAFGKNPPESVSFLLNMKSLNFAFQHDSLFLLSSTPAELAKLLNDMAGLDEVDISLRSINSRIWHEDNRVKTHEKEKESLEEELDKYEGLEKLEEDVADLEKMERVFFRKKQDFKKLSDLLQSITNREKEILTFSSLEKARSILTGVSSQILKKKELANRTTALSSLLEQIKAQEEKLQKFKDLPSAKKKASKTHKSTKSLQESIFQLKKDLEALRTIHTRIQELNSDIKKLKYEFRRKMPKICPLCGK